MTWIAWLRWGLLALLLMPGAVSAQTKSPAPSLAALIRPFLILPADSGGDWAALDRHPSVRWAGEGPTMSSRPSPDGNYFARLGQGVVAGRTVQVVATGARSMVFSVYVRDPQPLAGTDAVAAELRQAGFAVTPARCALDPRAAASRVWHRLTLPGRKPAFLFAGAVPSGGAGYTLYLADLPPMSPADAALYTDDCARPGPGAAGAAAGSGGSRPAIGAAGVASLIEAVLRPAGSPPAMPWTAVRALPGVTFPGAPLRMSNPYADAGEDTNPRLLDGEYSNPTTRMHAVVTGDDRMANRFLFQDGQRLARGAVFEALMRDGFQIIALRCGKAYTENSSAWYRISGGGRQPAILYRAHHNGGGRWSEDYAIRLDNVLPPALPGQSTPVGGRCPGP